MFIADVKSQAEETPIDKKVREARRVSAPGATPAASKRSLCPRWLPKTLARTPGAPARLPQRGRSRGGRQQMRPDGKALARCTVQPTHPRKTAHSDKPVDIRADPPPHPRTLTHHAHSCPSMQSCEPLTNHAHLCTTDTRAYSRTSVHTHILRTPVHNTRAKPLNLAHPCTRTKTRAHS